MTNSTNVLYVEDDRMSRMVMKMLLDSHSTIEHTFLFEDSEDFVARVQSLNPIPDLIFLDIHVPPIDGFEMLTILRRMPEFKEKTIVALTASVMNEEIEELVSAGFNGCIAKPLNPELFPDLLDKILAGQKIWHISGQ